MKLFIKTCLCVFLTVCYVHSKAQVLDSLIKRGQKLQHRKSREILYLQLDKASFLLGDTLSFSAYLLDSHYYTPSEKSGIAYIELISPYNGLEKRMAIHLIMGHGFGIIPLSETLTPGYYHIRAYTRWMENFPDSLFFHKDIQIAGGANNWSMNITHLSMQQQPKEMDSVSMKFFLKDQYGISLINNLVGINIVNGRNKVILKKTLMTQSDGSLSVHFNLDDKKVKQKLSLQVLDETQEIRISVPIANDSAANKLDIQFLPESGYLLAGEENHVAFKAIDENGKSIPVNGIIRDSRGDSVAGFASTYNGMGNFDLSPKSGEKYRAEIKNNPPVDLPEVRSSGTSVHVDALTNPDSVSVSLHFTKDLTGKQFYIVAKSRGLICYGAKVHNLGHTVGLNIDQNVFPNGISSVCLLNSEGRILNERPFFINHEDPLDINIETSREDILTRDSIALKIKVTDGNHQPVQGIFSLAVTDDGEVKKNKTTDENILSYFLLTSDLKGTIETPGYYFSDTTVQKAKALDLLMMTQGYVRYNWDSTLNFTPEPEYEITGSVSSLFNKPVNQAKVSLISMGKYWLFKDTLTAANGKFVFRGFPFFDTTSFFVQARSKRGKKFGIGIQLDENTFPAIPDYLKKNDWPANVNMDTTLQKRIQRYANYAETRYGRLKLADVIVKSKAAIEGSENLNGAGLYDQAFSKEILERMKDSSLYSILKQDLKGFYIGSCSAKDPHRYCMLNGNKIIFVFDGIRLDQFYESMDHMGSADPYLDFIMQYLNYYTAKDIKGIEVMSSTKYTGAYLGHYLSAEETRNYNPVMGCPYSFIEITTYGKQGPYMKANVSASVIKPVPFSYGKEFYQPRYVNRTLQDSLPDVRSTIYWHPFIITDKSGMADLYFFSGNSPSTYTIWMEGMSLDGKLGLKVKKVKVVDQ